MAARDALLDEFITLFHGNTSFFITHQAPFTEKDGRLKASWCGFAKYGTKSFPRAPEGSAKGDLVPVTRERYRGHLAGENGLALSPLCNFKEKRNVCYYGVIDIDVYGTNFTWFVRRLYQTGFKFSAFLSKSGGLHIYFFFPNAEPGTEVIELLWRIVDAFGMKKLFVNEKMQSKVEVFPKQAVTIPGDKNANCLFLPFYNGGDPKACKNKLLVPEGKLVGIPKAFELIKESFTTAQELRAVLDKLPYADAPYCIQSILLSGALGDDSGRNTFLYNVAVYLRKKYKEDFYTHFEDANNCLESPLETEEAAGVYNSVAAKGYDGYKCKEYPCEGYCNKALCKQREFGVGRDKGNHLTGAKHWGELIRYDNGEGKEPSYTWEVQVVEGGEIKKVQVDSHKDLLNQAAMQQYCLRDLNWIPYTVNQNDWIDNVLKCLAGIEDRTFSVPLSADTTEMARLRESFYKFLTHKQIQRNGQPYMVKSGQVYHAGGAYYFDTKGLLDYLQMDKVSTQKTNLGKWLVDVQYCVPDTELSYTNVKGEKRIIRCWMKPDTPELLSMDAFYEDVYEGDADIIRKNPLNKDEKKEEIDGDDVRY